MIALTLLFFIGRVIEAPVWYWVIWGIGTLDWVLDFILKIMNAAYKEGRRERV